MSAAIGSDTAGMSDDVALSDDTSPQPLLTTPHTREGYLILKQPPRSQPLTRSRDRLDHNAITNSAFMGTVGLEWQISGVGNFSSRPGESDVIMRNTTTGGLQLYDIANNAITGSSFLGAVGLDWQFAGVAPVKGAGTSDLVLRNVNTGAFEAYNIANNQLTGAASLGPIDLQWQLGGLAADPPAGAMGSAGGADANVSQLVQAMAAFGGGDAGDTLTTLPLGPETSQEPLLATPRHG
jgi:hypothetical protein